MQVAGGGTVCIASGAQQQTEPSIAHTPAKCLQKYNDTATACNGWRSFVASSAKNVRSARCDRLFDELEVAGQKLVLSFMLLVFKSHPKGKKPQGKAGLRVELGGFGNDGAKLACATERCVELNDDCHMLLLK
eukprot:4826387-Pleurochrysis_carterae.AAC.11